MPDPQPLIEQQTTDEEVEYVDDSIYDGASTWVIYT